MKHYDGVGGWSGGYPAKALDVFKPGDVLVSIQRTTLPPVAHDAQRGIRVAGLLVKADRLAMTALADLATAGELIPTVAATFPLDEAAAAQSAKAGPGKVVITLS
jgi:NADPH:quinone reductase-like Zn-dependent oxidoreductase